MQKKMAIALTTKPEDPGTKTTLEVAKTALDKKIDVYLYVTDDGVYNLKNDSLFDLKKQGAKLFVCAYGCQNRDIPIDDPRATYCGLVVLSTLIEGTDRFFSLN
ncbi:MAG: DsrE family protein [Nitrospiria bacterium]